MVGRYKISQLKNFLTYYNRKCVIPITHLIFASLKLYWISCGGEKELFDELTQCVGCCQLSKRTRAEGWQGDRHIEQNKQKTDVGPCAHVSGKAAQQIDLAVPEGCTDRNAENFDPTARSDDGTCVYDFKNL